MPFYAYTAKLFLAADQGPEKRVSAITRNGSCGTYMTAAQSLVGFAGATNAGS
jgi:hypothetical protein